MTEPQVPPIEWDEEVELLVTVRVKASGQPEADYGRTAGTAAMQAVLVGRSDLSRIDGYADLEGDADIIDIREWP